MTGMLPMFQYAHQYDTRHNWNWPQVVNSHLVCDPTIRQPGFYLPRQQWSLLNRFRTEQGHCGACRRKWRLTDTDLCPCCETQTMSLSHTVESCPLTKLNGGYTLQMKTLFRGWSSYSPWHAYENKKKTMNKDSIKKNESLPVLTWTLYSFLMLQRNHCYYNS